MKKFSHFVIVILLQISSVFSENINSKNFSEADSIRKELLSKGITLLDSKNGTEWTIQ